MFTMCEKFTVMFSPITLFFNNLKRRLYGMFIEFTDREDMNLEDT